MINYNPDFIDLLKEDPELRTAIQDKNFSYIYKYLHVNVYRGMFTQFCYDVLKINPLEHLDYIPADFFLDGDITTFNIPDHIKTIRSGAFRECTSLKSIVIPDGVEHIESNTFEGCGDLKRVTIPNTVKTIGDHCFSRCYSLNNIIFKGTYNEWLSIDKGWNWNKSVPTSCVIKCLDHRTTF